MKINEQLGLITSQAPQKKPQDNLNFEQWITTPTKQNNGDEYYWQHQNQLEQSSVRFDPKPLVLQPKKQEIPASSNPEKNTPSPALTSTIPVQHGYFSFQPETRDVRQLKNVELSKVIIDLEQELTQIMAPYGETNEPLETDTPLKTKEINSADIQLCNKYQFKNHHLFIQDEQVELTLNTKDLNHKEQRELTQIMKHHLKNKGLNLSKLIINGVPHD